MNDPHALRPWDAGAPPAALLRGTAAPGGGGELLRSPASGSGCVHWRLRIFESVASGVELVHEVMAPEPFDIAWREPGEESGPARPVRLASERVKIVAQPTLHPEGSPGALAVAQHFALAGRLRVEEVLIRPGAELEAEGLLFDPEQMLAGPYRGGPGTAELFEATVRLPTAISLRPALLPWALGTAAALLTAAGATTAISKLRRVGLDEQTPAENQPTRRRMEKAIDTTLEPPPEATPGVRPWDTRTPTDPGKVAPKRPRRPRWP
jgi:hypothetical protein